MSRKNTHENHNPVQIWKKMLNGARLLWLVIRFFKECGEKHLPLPFYYSRIALYIEAWKSLRKDALHDKNSVAV